MESWEVILLMKLLQEVINEAIASSDNEVLVESREVILLMKLLQAVTMKYIVESREVILLMKLLQAVI